ncbi:MAG: hypothetical protein PUB22_00155 [Clostridiales bacterium]|nr:hypothetical protein [Clostridiales bacterium]
MSENNHWAFDVQMKTSIGPRFGHMTVYRNCDRLSGILEILNHREPFEGFIDEEGHCHLSGRIITLVRTIDYKATGKITPDNLELSIIDDRYVLKIYGTPSQT